MSKASVADLAQQFIENDTNVETAAAAKSAVQRGDEAELTALFAGRLEFGTAGLRGPMGAGFTRMNELTVIQAAQGLVAYLIREYGDSAKERGILLGYDHRASGSLNSRRFAHLTASAALQEGMNVHLYDNIVCTPLVPFGIRKLNCIAGVMVTASHNPKEDNGYKVYGGLGAQIISPVDKYIATLIDSNLVPWDRTAYVSVSEESIRAHPLCMPNQTQDMIEQYMTQATAALCRHAKENADASLARVGICYTAMHGVGTPFTTALMQRFGLPAPTLTTQQVQPDPTFPTVAFPNPEEGKGALSLAMAAADAAGATLILANDPDADRLAVAEWLPTEGGAKAPWSQRQPGQAGEWRVFTGNEIGALLASWMWRGWQLSHPGIAPGSLAPGDRPCMLASTVSSKMLGAMAETEGFTFQETLTGFKWMGSAMADHEAKGTGTVLFSFEEAIGFSVWPFVRDKDGVTAAAVFAEMACALAREGKRCTGHLYSLFDKYGWHVTNNGYVFVDAPAKTEAIFLRLRNEGHYWLKAGNLAITAVRDLTGQGWDSESKEDGGKPSLPTSSGSHMITFKVSTHSYPIHSTPNPRWLLHSMLACSHCHSSSCSFLTLWLPRCVPAAQSPS